MKINKKVAFVTTLFVGALLFPLNTLSKSKSSTDTVVLSDSNTIVLSGEIDGDVAGQVIFQAKKLGNKYFSKDVPLYVFINTPGGSIQVGLEMIESLKGLGRPVSTITLFSASMGFQVAEALGERLILKSGILMSHRAAGEFNGNFGGQRPSQMDNRYNIWISRLTELDQAVVDRTNGKQTLASYQKAYADELWLTGSQAVASGYADRVVTVKCDSSLDGVNKHSVEFFGMKITYDLDKCPINTSPMNVQVSSPDQKSMTVEKVKETEAKFTEQYTRKLHSVVPMYW